MRQESVQIKLKSWHKMISMYAIVIIIIMLGLLLIINNNNNNGFV